MRQELQMCGRPRRHHPGTQINFGGGGDTARRVGLEFLKYLGDSKGFTDIMMFSGVS